MLPWLSPILDPSTLFACLPLPSSCPLVMRHLTHPSLPPHFVCNGWLLCCLLLPLPMPPLPPPPLCLFASDWASNSTIVRSPDNDRKWSLSFMLTLAIVASLSLFLLALHSFDNNGSPPPPPPYPMASMSANTCMGGLHLCLLPQRQPRPAQRRRCHGHHFSCSCWRSGYPCCHHHHRICCHCCHSVALPTTVKKMMSWLLSFLLMLAITHSGQNGAILSAILIKIMPELKMF